MPGSRACLRVWREGRAGFLKGRLSITWFARCGYIVGGFDRAVYVPWRTARFDSTARRGRVTAFAGAGDYGTMLGEQRPRVA
jgi:hypothetical protein